MLFVVVVVGKTRHSAWPSVLLRLSTRGDDDADDLGRRSLEHVTKRTDTNLRPDKIFGQPGGDVDQIYVFMSILHTKRLRIYVKKT